MRLSDLKQRLFGPDQNTLNTGPTTQTQGEVSILKEGQRRSKLGAVAVFALCAVVVFSLMRSSNTAAKVPPPPGQVKTEVHPSETTSMEAMLRALKNTELPQVLGGTTEGISAGDIERNKLALEAYERQDAAKAGAHAAGTTTGGGYGQSSAVVEDPITQEKRKQRLDDEKHEHSALFANPVITVGSASAAAEPASDFAKATPDVSSDKPAEATEEKAGETLRPSLAGKSENTDCVDVAGKDNETRYCLPEGTPIPVRLSMRAISDLAGPVKAVVARDVYSQDRQHKLIPGGTELIGKAHGLGSTWQERLSITFDRMLLADGRSVTLKEGLGLDQYGSMGVRDKVNRHITGKILTVLSLGALSTLAGAGTSAGYNQGYGDVYRQSVSQQSAMLGQQMMQKQLNRPNSLTIEEGKVMDLWLSEDVHLPEWNRQ
jgi:type IV secretory pathway VirB10-like protein